MLYSLARRLGTFGIHFIQHIHLIFFSIYVAIQETITRKHLRNWLAEAAKTGAGQPIMMTARAMNMDTSLRVFCGNHIPEHAAREINEKYWAITQALELVNFPLALPGTKVYKAIQARKVALRWLELAAHNSKIAMANGAEPECMLDEWVQSLADPTYKGRKEFSDLEMAMVVFSFLFASQDAMSSGLIYGFQHLADHPEAMAKVKEEQERVRQGDYERPLSLETLAQMPYLQAVVKESMRVQPPVLMVCWSPYMSSTPLLINSVRFHTKLPKPSPSLMITLFQQTAWSSHPFTTLFMTAPFTPIQSPLPLRGG